MVGLPSEQKRIDVDARYSEFRDVSLAEPHFSAFNYYCNSFQRDSNGAAVRIALSSISINLIILTLLLRS